MPDGVARRMHAHRSHQGNDASARVPGEAEETDPGKRSTPSSVNENRLEVWMTLEEAAQATGLPQAALRYWEETAMLSSRVVSTPSGGRKEVLLSDVMRELRTNVHGEIAESEESGTQFLLQAENETLRHEIELLRDQRELVERRANLSQAIADERQGRIEDLERGIERAHAERDEALALIERMRTEGQELAEELQSAVGQQEELTTELERIGTEREQLIKDIGRLWTERQALIEGLQQSRTAEESLAGKLEQGEVDREHVRSRMVELEAVVERLQSGFEEIKHVADVFIGPREDNEA